VVLGELLELLPAAPVDPGVADMGELDPVVDDGYGDDRRPHAPERGIAPRGREDRLVRDPDAGDEPVLLVALPAIHLERPGAGRVLPGLLEEPAHGRE